MLGKWIAVGLVLLAVAAKAEPPVKLIFDTDMGNDVDDALALGMIHALQSRGECELLCVTATKDHPLAAPYLDAINTFYGRGDIPIGVVKGGVTPEDSKFLPIVETMDEGRPRYPHSIKRGEDAPDATALLREVLAGQPDQSVVIVQVGFSTNLARLLDSAPDEHSPLAGRELAERKVRTISIMAGAFKPIDGNTHLEYNVVMDIPSARRLAAEWPTPIIWSGFEIGLALPYPAASIEQDFRYIQHHPLAESYQLYEPTPHERPTWDLTSVLWAVRPGRGYFDLSEPGRVEVLENGETVFHADGGGKQRYLLLKEQERGRVIEALAALSSQPPDKPARRVGRR